MDKYEELKFYTEREIEKDVQSIKSLQTKIAQTEPTSVLVLAELAKELTIKVKDLCLKNIKMERLTREEEKIRQMLSGFYESKDGMSSFLYTPIDICHIPEVGYIYYRVQFKGFTNKEKAISYSLSLGERKDVIKYAYNWL